MLTSFNIWAAKMNDINSFIFNGTYDSNWTMLVLNSQTFNSLAIHKFVEWTKMRARCVCVCIAVYCSEQMEAFVNRAK